ncbi:hypothetical protein FRB99_006038, partial [Tulasnella sp. 403]
CCILNRWKVVDTSLRGIQASTADTVNNATAILEELETTRSAGRAAVIDRPKLIFDADSQIGSGQFGTLFRAQLLNDATPADVTIVSARQLSSVDLGDQPANRLHVVGSLSPAHYPFGQHRLGQEMVKKADKWSDLNHPNIVKFIGYYPSGPAVSREFLLIFPYLPGGHLAKYLEQESLDYAQRIKLV